MRPTSRVATGVRHDVSTDGHPLAHLGRWRDASDVEPRRRELLYAAADGRLMAVAINTGAGFDAGIPKPLFELGARLAFGADHSGAQLAGGGGPAEVTTDPQQDRLIARCRHLLEISSLDDAELRRVNVPAHRGIHLIRRERVDARCQR